MRIEQIDKQQITPHSDKVYILWFARISSLAFSVFLIIWRLRTMIKNGGWGTSFFENWGTPFFGSWDYLVLLVALPGAIAWRWHRIGGILLVLIACFVLVYNYYELAIYQGKWDMGVVMFGIYIVPAFSLIIGTGGILHLVYWYKEKKLKPIT